MSIKTEDLVNVFMKQNGAADTQDSKEQPDAEVKVEENEDNQSPESEIEQEAQLEEKDEQAAEDEEDESLGHEESTEAEALKEMEFKLIINGEEKVVKGVEELKKGYMLQSDYTRKSQELARQAQEQTAQFKDYGQKTMYAATTFLSEAEAIVENFGGLDAMRQQLPAEQYQQFVDKYSYWHDLHEQTLPVIQGIEQQYAKQRETEVYNTFVALKEAIPGFDQKQAEDLIAYATTNMSAAEIEKAPVTKEFWTLLHKAKLFDDGQTKLAKAKTTGKVQISAPSKGKVKQNITSADQEFKKAAAQVRTAKDK